MLSALISFALIVIVFMAISWLWYLVSPESLGEWWYSFTTNNNTRLLTFWIICFIWLVGNLILFGIGSGVESPYPYEERVQMHYNWYKTGKFVTDRELHPYTSFGNDMHQFIGSGSWRDWWYWFFFSLLYIPWSLRDEIGRFGGTIIRRVGEKRKGKEKTAEPTQQKETITQTEAKSKFGGLARELGKEAFAEYTVDFVKRIGRKR